ncbi:hypothetical protein [Burkholderia orbicola]|uniref:hypothetical protein n=1 Tax=Burkholderia orbicola TaxID=2978683 RepID=UPI002FE0B8DA
MANPTDGLPATRGSSAQEYHAYNRNFVSVMDVVKSVARNISTEEFEREFQAREHERGQTYFGKIGGALNRQIRSDHTCKALARAFQIASAAAGLEDFLRHSTDHVPRWFGWGTTGRPRLDDAVRTVGMEMLIHVSQYDKKCVGAWESGNFNLGEHSDGIRDAEKRFNELDKGLDLAQIGFEQTELFEFLARNNIPYTIDDLQGECLLTNPQLFQYTSAAEVASERVEQTPPVGLGTSLTSAEPIVAAADTNSCDSVRNGVVDGAHLGVGQTQAHRLAQAAQEELTQNLTTSELAVAFADMGDCKYRTGKDDAKWEAYLQEKRRVWMVAPHIRVQPGGSGRGRTARWNPLEFAKGYVSNEANREILVAFDERFRKVRALAPWKDEWTLWAADFKESLETPRGGKPVDKTRRI